MSKLRKGIIEFPNRHKPVLMFDLNDNFIKEYRTLKYAILDYGKSVWQAVNGYYKTAYGYKWKYKQDLNING